MRAGLTEIDPLVFYNDIAEIRPAGEWPGKEDFDRFVSLFWVIAGVSLLSALVLVATTMTTLVRDQTREIGIMKAVGGRGRSIARSFLTTALLLGGAATLVGIAVGFLIANLLVDFLGGRFLGIDPGWQVSPLAVGLSLAVGLGVTAIASVPALWRAARVPVREALETAGIEARYGTGRLDRAVARARFLPSPVPLRAAERGPPQGPEPRDRRSRRLRRRHRRRLRSSQSHDAGDQRADRETRGRRHHRLRRHLLRRPPAPGCRRPRDDAPRRRRRSGPALRSRATSRPTGIDTWAWGLPADTIYDYELLRGRWFDDEEVTGKARVAVIGKALASQTGLDVGDTVTVEDRTGLVATR